MSEHLNSKLGLENCATDVTDVKYMGNTSDEKAERHKLALAKGGAVCKTKKAMGGVGKERLGQSMAGNVSRSKLGEM